MADVFISYAREDREWVERLARQLQAEGFSVWWDWDLLVGKRYRETIDTELSACKAAVVVWSKSSVRSDFVRDEAEEGQQRDVLVPVLKEAVRPPAGFRQIQSADLSNWRGGGAHDELRRVMKGVAQLVGRPAAGDSGDAALEPATAQPPLNVAVPMSRSKTKLPVATYLQSLPQIDAKRAVSAVVAWLRPLVPFIASLLARLPARSRPLWRYLAIGVVGLLVLIYVAGQISALLPSGRNAPGGAGSDTTSTGAPPAGTTTDIERTSNDVARVARQAEVSDQSARVRAALAVTQGKLAAAAAARVDQNGEGPPVGRLNGRDSIGNTFAFAGEIAEGSEQGVGVATISNGSHYSGQWYGGIAQGLGVFTYGNGDQYFGEFDDNQSSGLGAAKFSDPARGLGYSGQWAANMFNGYGVFYFQNGARLEGHWRAGQLNGLGAKFDSAGKLLEQGTYENSVLRR